MRTLEHVVINTHVQVVFSFYSGKTQALRVHHDFEHVLRVSFLFAGENFMRGIEHVLVSFLLAGENSICRMRLSHWKQWCIFNAQDVNCKRKVLRRSSPPVPCPCRTRAFTQSSLQH